MARKRLKMEGMGGKLRALESGLKSGEPDIMEVMKDLPPLPKTAAEAQASMKKMETMMSGMDKLSLGGELGAGATMKIPSSASPGKIPWKDKIPGVVKKWGGIAIGAMFLHYVLSSLMTQKQEKGLAATEMEAALMGMKPEAAANEEITRMMMGDYSRNKEAYLAALSPNYPAVASGESAALGGLVRRISRTKTAVGGGAGAGSGGPSPEELMAALSAGQ